MSITELYSYPVKGLSSETYQSVDLRPYNGFPSDRKFALALPQTEFDPTDPKPFPKFRFLMLAKNERLANLSTHYDEAEDRLTIRDRSGSVLCEAVLHDADGKAAIEGFFYAYLDDVLSAPPRLVQAEGHQFTDVSVISKEMMHAVSLINLASLRALEAATGTSIHPMRFRANVYFDNGEPWSEFDWIGKDVQLGTVMTKGVKRTKRCPATQVNPDTAERDIDTPAEILKHFGHPDLGIYVEVQSEGRVSVGDAVSLLS